MTGNCTGGSEDFPQDDAGTSVGGANFINIYSTAGSTDPIVQRLALERRLRT